MWLVANWKVVLTAIAVGTLAFLLHTLDVYRLEDAQKTAVDAAVKSVSDKCNENNKISEEVSNDFKKKSDDLAAELARAKRVRPTTCVPVLVTNPASGSNGSAGSGQSAVKNGGVASDALLDLAAEGERYRLQLIGCQTFWSNYQASVEGESK